MIWGNAAQRPAQATAEVESSPPTGAKKGAPNAAHVEELLSDKLLQGFLLTERSCPRCETPLVKQEQALRTQEVLEIHSPVPGVPFCVKCCAHVMTDESELLRIQRCFQGQSMQGKILIDFDNGKALVDEATVATEETSLASDTDDKKQHNDDAPKEETRDDDHDDENEKDSTKRTDIRIMVDGEIEIVPGEEMQPQVLSDNESVVESVVENIHTKRQASSPAVNGTPQSRRSYLERIKLKHSQSQTNQTPRTEDDGASRVSVDPPESNKNGTPMSLGNNSSSSVKTPKDEFWPSFDERKQIATKVLSVKMLQGHRLLQTQCRKCSMPMTECEGVNECVVCPVLHKRSMKLKEKKAQEDRVKTREDIQDIRMLMSKTVVQKNKNQFFEHAKQKSSLIAPEIAQAKIESDTNEPAGHDPTMEERELPQDHTAVVYNVAPANEAKGHSQAPIVQSTDVFVMETGEHPGAAILAMNSGVVSPIVHKDHLQLFKGDEPVIGNQNNEPLIARAALGATPSPPNADQLKVGKDAVCDHTAPTMDPTLNTDATGSMQLGGAPQIVEVESSVGSNSVVRQYVEPKDDLEQPRGATSIITGCTGQFGQRSKIASPTKKSLLDRAGNKPKLQKKTNAAIISNKAYLKKPVTKTPSASVEGAHKKPSFGVNGNSERAVMGIMKVSPQQQEPKSEKNEELEMADLKGEMDQSKPTSAEKTEKIKHSSLTEPSTDHPIENKDASDQEPLKNQPNDDEHGEQDHEKAVEDSSRYSSLHSDSTISTKTTKVVYSAEGCEAIDIPPENVEEPNAEKNSPKGKSTLTVKRSLKSRSMDSGTKRSLAKQEMAKRMATGWILLNAACPKCTMPLMADTQGENEMCVSCHTSEMEEKNPAETKSAKSSKRERSDPGGDESTLEEAELSVRNTKDSDEATKDIDIVTSDSSISVAKQSIEIPTNEDDDGKSRARAMWSTMTKTRTSRKLVPPRHDPPAVQGHTVRRKEAQDCEQSTIHTQRQPSKKASLWLSAGVLASSFLMGQSTNDQEEKADPVEVKQIKKNSTPRADPDASMSNVLRNKVFGGEKKVGSSPLDVLSDNRKNRGGVKLDPDGPKEEEEEVSLGSKDGTSEESSVAVSEVELEPSDDTEDDEAAESTLIKSRGPSPEDVASMFSSRGAKSETSSELSEATGDIQIVRMPNSATSTVELKHTPTGTDESEILSLAIPPGFDINNQDALRQLLAAAKKGMPLTVKTSLDEIEEETHIGRAASPGMSEARLPMNSPLSPENQERRRSRTFGSRSQRLATINNSKKTTKKSEESSALMSENGTKVSEISQESRSLSSLRQNKSLGVSTATGDSYTTPILISSPQSRELKSRNYQLATSSTGSQPETIIVLDDVIEGENAYDFAPKQEAEISDHASVTSEAIDALLLRIEETQTQLALAGDEEDSLEKREKLARLLEQLSAAAAAVEEMDPDCTSQADTTSIVS